MPFSCVYLTNVGKSFLSHVDSGRRNCDAVEGERDVKRDALGAVQRRLLRRLQGILRRIDPCNSGKVHRSSVAQDQLASRVQVSVKVFLVRIKVQRLNVS